MDPTEPEITDPADSRPLDQVLDEAVARVAAERDEREQCLYRAMRLTLGDERYSEAMDAILDVAEYLRTGQRGLPLPPPQSPPVIVLGRPETVDPSFAEAWRRRAGVSE